MLFVGHVKVRNYDVKPYTERIIARILEQFSRDMSAENLSYGVEPPTGLLIIEHKRSI